MLVIRKAQMEALDADARRLFLQKTLLSLRRRFSKQTAKKSDDRLLAFVQASMERAGTFGINGETDLRLFVDLEFLLKPRFEESPGYAWVRGLLEAEPASPDARMFRVYQRLDSVERGETPPG